MADEPTSPTAVLPRGIDTNGKTHPADGTSDETLPGSLHARVVRGLARGTTVGRYLVLEELGRGGMGVVYAAFDPELDRRIAIKVLSGRSEEGTAGSTRLLREAQALAKLAHPNVIGVFDVGAIGDEIFIAMELVAGGTLKDHVANKPWDAIVAAYVAAGRGLAAAHAAGLVHRDFKPDNVLVGADGRPRVTDFGLVRATSGGSTGATDPDPGRTPSAGSALDSALTAAGAVMGTPSFMAPEQMMGEPTTAASDQYSFAVAMWDALFATKPYGGADVPGLHAAIVAGKKLPYERGPVPVRVVHALERALSPVPDDRWPSMDALLVELESAARPAAPRWIAAAIVVLGLIALGIGGTAALSGQRDACGRAGDPAATLWSRDRVAPAFSAAAPGFGSGAVDMVERWVGVWRDDWQRRARAACQATRVQRTQSDEILDLRMTCLDRKLEAARAIVDGLARADRATVEHAGDAMVDLPELADCDDVAVLRGRQARPTDVAARSAVAALERELGQLEGRRATTFSADARAALRTELAAAVTRAEATGYAPVIAQARWIDGELAIDLADGKAARAALVAAAAAATRGGDPAALADAYTSLATVATDLVVDFPAAQAWVDLGGAVIEGLREPAERRVLIEEARARLARAEGDFPAARAALDRALATPDLPAEYRLGLGIQRAVIDTSAGDYAAAQQAIDELLPIATERLGANHPRRAHLIHDKANLAYYRGEYATAADLHREALGLYEAAYGKDAPEILRSLQGLAIDENMQGNIDVARAHLDRALAIARATYGADHREVAALLGDLAGTYHRARDYERELAINREVLAILTRVLGPDHPDTAMTMVNIGIAAKNLGRARKDRALIAQAIESEEAARAIFVAKLGPDHFQVAATDDNLGWAYHAAGRHTDAIAAFTRAEAGFAKATSPDHPVIADPLTGRGLAELELGRAPAAVEVLERAVTLRSAPDMDPGDLAESRFALARALRAAGKEPARARELAEKALAVWADRGPGDAAHAAEARRFVGSGAN
jgi:tetratricopeptide (TPR) repeat protein